MLIDFEHVRSRGLKYPGWRAKSGGFTLIELLVAMAVLGIVLAIAIPNYRQWVLESGRAEGKAILMEGASALERCFTRASQYTGCAYLDVLPDLSETGKYQLTATRVTDTEFDLAAAPQGGQAEDTECGTFELSHTGARDASGSGGAENCW